MVSVPEDEEPEMLRREFVPEEAETFLAVYRRYRRAVREELEGAGLSPVAAEVEVGAVFLEMMNTLGEVPPDAPLGPHLRELARRTAEALSGGGPMTARMRAETTPFSAESEPCGGGQAARARLVTNPGPEERAALTPLLNDVEHPWAHLRRLVDAYEAHGRRAAEWAHARGLYSLAAPFANASALVSATEPYAAVAARFREAVARR